MVQQSFTSVTNGKQKVASALATKGQEVANDATFNEIYQAILGIDQTIVAGDTNIPAASIKTIF